MELIMIEERRVTGGKGNCNIVIGHVTPSFLVSIAINLS